MLFPATEEFERLPIILQEKPLSLLAKGGSALALSAVIRPWLLRQIAQQCALHMARYQVATQALVKGGPQCGGAGTVARGCKNGQSKI